MHFDLRRFVFALLLLTLNVVSASADNTDFTSNRTDFRDESIYFLMTTRFYDGDPTNNVLCWDYQSVQESQGDPFWRGDFAGVIAKLDYIKALGFTAIWITPIAQNGSGVDYHGYHAMDISSEDIRLQSHKGKGKYGGFKGLTYNGDTFNDVGFQQLVEAAHKKGIKVILDIVLNHTGNFGEVNLCHEFNRSQNILNQADIDKCMLPNYDVMPSNYLQMQASVQYQTRLALMKNTDGKNHDTNNYWHHYGSFNWDEPNRWWAQIAGDCVDLNTENPAVVDYLVKCYGKYIAMGVDGFRIDTTGHIARLSFNSALIPKLAALGEQYKSKRLNEAPFYMYGECCARYQGSVTYRGQPNLSPWFYTWKSDASLVSKYNSVTADQWASTVVPEGSDTPLNMAYCLEDDAHSSNPGSTNVKMVNGEWHEPDYSESSGFNVIDFTMHYSFSDAASAYNYRGEDGYYNDASFNVIYVDSHDYCAGPNDGVRYNGGAAQWSENMDLMWTFRGVPCLFYGSEIEFKKGCVIDQGGVSGLQNTGRAYYGGYITGDINATDFGTYTANGNAKITLSQDLSQHLMKLNKIRQAVPALRKGQWTNDGCTCNGAMAAFKRAYNKDGIDSYALVCISGGATFSNVPAGTYTELVTGQTYQGGGTITVSCPSSKGQLRVLVKNYTGKSGAALTGGDGKFIYSSSSASVAETGWTDEEAGTDKYITPEDATGEAGVYFTPAGGKFSTESLEVTAYMSECTSASFSVNGGAAKAISESGTKFTIGTGDPQGSTYNVTWTATTTDGEAKSGSVTFEKVGVYTPSCEEDERCVFFETDANTVGIWVWNNSANFTGGDWASKPNMEEMGVTSTGRKVYKWTYEGNETSMPTQVIFLPNGVQSADLEYKNHGYYIDNVWDNEVEAGEAKPGFAVDKQSQTFSGSIDVTITPKDDATVVYTTDGSQPTVSSQSTTVSKTLTFTKTTTLKVGYLSDGAVLGVKSYTYTYSEKPVGITIYVKSNVAPHLYAWKGASTTLNGSWPGTVMSDKTTVAGEEYWYKTFSGESNINIIFNNGNSGSGNQTADITGITEDSYFTWDGGSGYEKITPDGIEVVFNGMDRSNGSIIRVYTLDGGIAAEVADLQQAETLLRSGIYVINGRKFIVR